LSALNHFTVPTVMDACPSLRRLGGHDQRRSVLAPTAKDKLDFEQSQT
jgi:hypothetical protein